MLKVYGSELCPHCVACKAAFNENGVEYEYIDINKRLGSLKEFLKYRDTDPAFDGVIGTGAIGIPAIMREDGSFTLDWESCMKEQPKKTAKPAEEIVSGASCRIDGTGC